MGKARIRISVNMIQEQGISARLFSQMLQFLPEDAKITQITHINEPKHGFSDIDIHVSSDWFNDQNNVINAWFERKTRYDDKAHLARADHFDSFVKLDLECAMYDYVPKTTGLRELNL